VSFILLLTLVSNLGSSSKKIKSCWFKFLKNKIKVIDYIINYFSKMKLKKYQIIDCVVLEEKEVII
jgi:hypothetical protein